ncbi:MAG: hypothetical protein ACOYXT_18645 [Bacteroidota bacterium]
MKPEIKDKVQDSPWMKSLASCVNHLRKQGFKEDFQVSNGKVHTFNNESKAYKPEQVKIVNFYRFEGASDPGDNSILYAIETDDAVKGTLVDAYGAYSNPDVEKFIVAVNEIEKTASSKSNA